MAHSLPLPFAFSTSDSELLHLPECLSATRSEELYTVRVGESSGNTKGIRMVPELKEILALHCQNL